jgi:thioredoxin-like negative regulator of GroEL
VDVDDVDSVAAEYGVAILPTVLVVQRATSAGAAVVVERYTGSNEAQLQAFVQAHLGQ